MGHQYTLFEWAYPQYKINKPLRLIELFAGYGSQAMALKRLGVPFEHYRVVEFDKYAVRSYNAVHGTDFEPLDITEITAEDLNVCDTDKYCYMMTYSFPCTDLSVAGKQAGMAKGSGTRSGLLWEVERLLSEMDELPQVLFMENVPAVHNKKNMPDFESWLKFLENLGYSNHWQDLNARDYGIAQNRNRCFMFSFLGDATYKFPEPFPLENTVRDYLEDDVDEKYYINTERANKLIEQLIEREQLSGENAKEVCDGTICKPLVKDTANTLKAGRRGIVNKQSEENVVVSIQANEIKKKINIAPTLNTTCGHFVGFTANTGVIEWKSKN